MTREELVAKMADIRQTLENQAKTYNELMLAEKLSDATDMNTGMTDLANEYTSIARTICFDECKAAADPMYEACKRLSFDTICVKDVNQEGSKYKIREIQDAVKVIDLKKLQKHCGGTIGKDPKWIYAIEKFNMLMTAQKCVDLGIDPKDVNDSYAMADNSRQYDLGKNPASKTNLLKTLTTIVHMMIGEEFKPVSHDVNFLLSIYVKKNRKALSVTCANHNYMRQYIEEICYRIINGLSYEVLYKTVK